MAREIKFRAWDPKRERMIAEPHHFQPHEEGQWYVYEDWRDHEDGNSFIGPVMQFTGLKDSEGREIYEGDILEFDAREWGNDRNNKAAVVWERDGWACMGVPSEWGQWCKVIGNIYENPELLGATTA